MEYSNVVSQQMSILEKLKVAAPSADLEQGFQGVPNARVIMQAAERTVVARRNEDIPSRDPQILTLFTQLPLTLRHQKHHLVYLH